MLMPSPTRACPFALLCDVKRVSLCFFAARSVSFVTWENS